LTPVRATRGGADGGAWPCGRSYLYSYLAMVPGGPGEWDDHYAWIFRTAMTGPSCTLSFYIPASPQTISVAYYWFSAGFPNAVGRIADFTIDQAVHQGEWVSHGPITFPGRGGASARRPGLISGQRQFQGSASFRAAPAGRRPGRPDRPRTRRRP
jgi:hypothetical protein